MYNYVGISPLHVLCSEVNYNNTPLLRLRDAVSSEQHLARPLIIVESLNKGQPLYKDNCLC